MSWSFICNICFHIAIAISFTSRRFTLTPDTVSSANDISVTLGSGATVISNLWSIDVNSQRGTDLTVHLGPTWGFNPNIASRIDLTLNGNTSNETYHDDGEILFVFNVEDQYFAEMISIDSRRIAYRECPGSNTPLITANTTKIIESQDPDNRYNRFCNNPSDGSIDNWQITSDTATGLSYKEPSQWPLYMSITNEPIANTVAYTWSDKSNPTQTIVSSLYTSSFNTNKGVDIHISGENQGEDFFIFSIDIMYHFFGTEAPTKPQTEAPTSPKPTTSAPTTSILPTVSPTGAPTTNMPSTAAPITTTKTPTAIPTAAPSVTTSTTIATTATTDIVTSETIHDTTTTVDDTIASEAYTSALASWNTTHLVVTHPPLEATLPKPTTVIADHTTVTMDDDDFHLENGEKTLLDLIPKRTWYIVIICGAMCLGVCCAVLFLGLRKIKHHEIAAKDYKGVPVVHGECGDADAVEIHIPKDGDRSSHVRHHSHKSSNDFHHSTDFSAHLSSAVTGDELLMDEIHHHMETDGHPVGYHRNEHAHTSDDDVLDDEDTDSYIETTGDKGKKHTFSSTKETHNKTKYFYDGQYEFNVNRHDYHGYGAKERQQVSSSEELLDAINEENTHGQYEIGMVTMSKISEMAPQSKEMYRNLETVGDLASLAKKINNDSLVMEGNELNDDYDEEEDVSSDELLKMETAGFIDGDYNQIEYEDEYYEDDD